MLKLQCSDRAFALYDDEPALGSIHQITASAVTQEEWVLFCDPSDPDLEAFIVPKGADLDDSDADIEAHHAQKFLSLHHYSDGNVLNDMFVAPDGARIPRLSMVQSHAMATFTSFQRPLGALR
ncbi:unnamed protein product [Prorocentrum cordatum]|uniref:Anaphase-promoting complex subunit 1 n=1 Tax=Prorocentrum cordatum TaxID=2364126 RepID=A0ABN9R9S8_9DINO|nr:unnamed protein product [Polarella glacialis]